MKPKVSVIIVSHYRKNFLTMAIHSVLSQSVSKDLFEIIIVKNFIDKQFDNNFTNLGIRIINTEEQTLGSKIVIGLENSNGEVISFLEDDDLFKEEKLKTVINLFRDPCLTYYHNNYTIINERGISINAHLPQIPAIRRSIFINRNKLNAKTLVKITNSNGFFNLSCISIRKSLILETLYNLENLDVAVDNFFFYLAIDSGNCIFIDTKELTGYRVHSSNSSLVVDIDQDIYSKRKEMFFRKDLEGFDRINISLKNQLTKTYLTYKMLIPELALSIFCMGNVQISKGFLSLIASLRIKSSQLFLISMLYIISSISPKTVVRLIYKFESNYIKRINKSA